MEVSEAYIYLNEKFYAFMVQKKRERNKEKRTNNELYYLFREPDYEKI